MLPWVTWPFQDPAIKRIEASIGKHPLAIEKSRDQGASWMVLAVYAHQFMFRKMRMFLLASEKQALVDDRQNPDALMWKLDFLFAGLPPWMQPPLERTDLHIYNPLTGSTIDGSSTNEDLGRGGRRLSVMYDEFAAVKLAEKVMNASASLTFNPIYVSTHKGVGTRFNEICRNPEHPKIVLHWRDHPWQSVGREIRGGKEWSPYIEYMEKVRGFSKQQMAAEIHINPEGSDYNLFDEMELKKLEEEHAKPPVIGELEIDLDKAAPLRWSENPHGKMSLWGPLVMGTDPPADREYVVGVDIAGGTGASNSVIFVGDCLTGEQVFEYATNTTLPHTLARIAVAICQWFRCDDGRGAFLIWESSGPTGGVFGQEVIALGYRNVYYRQSEDDLSASISTKYGYATTGATKEKGLGNLMQGMISGRLKVRSKAIYTEWRGYTFKNGKVEYSGSRQTGNEADKGTSHGDRVIAAMVAWHRMRIRVGKDPLVAMERKIPVGSLAWRRQLVEAEHRESDGTEQW